MDLEDISVELAQIEGNLNDNFRALSNGFQKLQKIKEPSRQSRQLEELSDKMRECKRLIKEFERVMKEEDSRNPPDTKKALNERKQAMIKELNSYVAMKKQHASENKRVDPFSGSEDVYSEENVLLASCMFSLVDAIAYIFSVEFMILSNNLSVAGAQSVYLCHKNGLKLEKRNAMTNEQLMDTGYRMMDETDEAIERSKQVVQETINVGAETTAALKAQTEQMSRIVNELDSIHFSIKKASKLAKELGRQIATDKCIMAMLFLITMGVIAIIIVKIVQPDNKDIQDIPGLPPPASRKLL
ncbi:hypothetical protein ZIOFF_075629 [Zingiber officinale]|uniref:t-SNARE coiled-coil homology domain-containing protein n=1 Tax=Zingiber officinale TaxID=94328 RepID=A0A8J5E8C8_ZINOF|nr:hypothetical protein ZIOFF_075629 [Zingiber officinale]